VPDVGGIKTYNSIFKSGKRGVAGFSQGITQIIKIPYDLIGYHRKIEVKRSSKVPKVAPY
jgi:hypothetical protein